MVIRLSEVILKVVEPKQKDVGNGIARIDQQTMRKLGISAESVIEITAKRKTSAKALPAYSEDENKGIIRIDGFIRKNAGVDINENVTVRPAKEKLALSITLAPIDMRLNVDSDFTNFVKNRLRDRTLVEGDTILVMMLGHSIPFMVCKTVPDGIVKVMAGSEVLILNEPLGETSQRQRESSSLISSIIALEKTSDETFDKLVEMVLTNLYLDWQRFKVEEIVKETGTDKELVQSTIVFLRDGLIWNNFTGAVSISSFQRKLLDEYKYPQTKIDILTKHFERNRSELRLTLMFREIQVLKGKLGQSLPQISSEIKELKQLYGHVLDVVADIREKITLMRQEQQKIEESNLQKQKTAR
jgi:hypothetical protein